MKLFCSLILAVLCFGVAASYTQVAATPKPLRLTVQIKPEQNKTSVQPLDVAKLSALLAESKTNRRPLLINFWATWCVPCREEFPDLVKIDKKYRAQGLDFFTVSADDATEIATTVPQFLLEVKAHNIPAYLIDSAESEQAINLIDAAWSGALQTTFLFDRTGNLVFKHSGRVNLAELETAVKAAMSDK